MNSTSKTARFAGALYFFWILTGLFGLFYVPSKIKIQGGVATAAESVLANESLFRLSIVNDLVSGAIWVVMALVLYRLFKEVNEGQARLLVALVLVQIPVMFFLEAFNIASLMILKGDVLKTFELAQRQDVAVFFLRTNDYASLTLELFWGLWLLPLAVLVYRSHFLPRFVGVWLWLNGVVYIFLCGVSILVPQYKDTVYTVSFPAMLGEVVFALWLMIFATLCILTILVLRP